MKQEVPQDELQDLLKEIEEREVLTADMVDTKSPFFYFFSIITIIGHITVVLLAVIGTIHLLSANMYCDVTENGINYTVTYYELDTFVPVEYTTLNIGRTYQLKEFREADQWNTINCKLKLRKSRQ